MKRLRCWLCGGSEKVEVHHMDCNDRNDNFYKVRLCWVCRDWIHRAGYCSYEDLCYLKATGEVSSY
jgi:hypothetical protein